MKAAFDTLETADFEDFEFDNSGEFGDYEDYEDMEFDYLGEYEDLGEFEEKPAAPARRGSRTGCVVCAPGMSAGSREFEDFGEFEAETGAPSRRRGAGSNLSFPPDTITVRPAFVLKGFCFDEHSLMERHIREIQAIAIKVVDLARRGRGPVTVRLVGHTDPVGSRAYNTQLGCRRAQEVGRRLRRFLSGRLNQLQRGGARLGQVSIVEQSCGETRSVASNRTERGRAQNRRVEVFFIQPPRP